jgi:hypothetical protein
MEKYQKEIYRGIMQLFLKQIVRKIQKYLSYFVLDKYKIILLKSYSKHLAI